MDRSSKERVIEFLKRMLGWECRLDTVRRSAQYKCIEEAREKIQNSARQELMEIFGEYLATDAIKKYGDRLKALVTRFPPEFDQEILLEFEENGGIAMVYASLKDRPTEKRRYQLILQENEWHIAEISAWRRSREKLEANILI